MPVIVWQLLTAALVLLMLVGVVLLSVIAYRLRVVRELQQAHHGVGANRHDRFMEQARDHHAIVVPLIEALGDATRGIGTSVDDLQQVTATSAGLARSHREQLHEQATELAWARQQHIDDHVDLARDAILERLPKKERTPRTTKKAATTT